jgi:hypothetical protein
MTERLDVTRSLHTAREVFTPTSEQQARVRAALRARLAPDAGSGTIASGARPAVQNVRALTLAKGGALIGIGFALGYWFAEIRAKAEDVSSTVPRGADERAGTEMTLLEGARLPDSALLLDGGRGPREAPSGESPRAAASAVDDGGALAAETAGTVSGSAALGASGAAMVRGASSAGNAPIARGASGAAVPRQKPRPRLAREPQRAAPASMSEELSLLQRAQRAIRAADGALARSFIAELDARFPKTTWREERSAILVLAACALGEPSAESDAREFLRRYSASVYLDRIQMLCRRGAAPSANGMTPRETGGPSSDTHRAEENP